MMLLGTAVVFAGCADVLPAFSEEPTAPATELTAPAVEMTTEQLTEEVLTVPTESLPPETTEPPRKCPLPLDDWRLQLVNREHPVENIAIPEMRAIRRGMQVDSRCYDDLVQMMSDCKAAGYAPLICSAYRDLDYQTKLFGYKVKSLQAEGMTEDEAYAVAQTVVAIPGTSEHHLGLAVDIVDQSYQELNEFQEQTEVQQWLLEHCWEYGFILRYPNGKSDITGIIYEPWHYRYVGKEVADEIRSSGLCLEEYLAQFQP